MGPRAQGGVEVRSLQAALRARHTSGGTREVPQKEGTGTKGKESYERGTRFRQWAANIGHLMRKTLCNFEPQFWLEFITLFDVKSACFKGSRTSCDMINSGIFRGNL